MCNAIVYVLYTACIFSSFLLCCNASASVICVIKNYLLTYSTHKRCSLILLYCIAAIVIVCHFVCNLMAFVCQEIKDYLHTYLLTYLLIYHWRHCRP